MELFPNEINQTSLEHFLVIISVAYEDHINVKSLNV